MSLPRFVLPILLGFGMLPSFATADVVTLKSGEKIEGKVVKESATEVSIEYKASASITDVRVLPKSDIANVEKESAEETEWLALKSLAPGPNSLAAASYEGPIARVQNFGTTYPASAHAAEASQLLATLQDEKARVEAGGLKIDGQWLSKETVQKERYQLSARLLLAQMQEQAHRGDYVGALNTFDQIERNFPGASVFPEAATAAQQAVAQLKATADRALQSWHYQKKELDDQTKLVPEPRRTELISLQKKEQAQFDAQVEAATKGNIKWPPLLARSEKSLTTLTSKAAEEAKRLAALPLAKIRQAIPLTEQARAALASGDFAAAQTLTQQATTLWPEGEAARRLLAEIAAAQSHAKATPMPVATPDPAPPAEARVATPAPATPVPAPPAAPAAVANVPDEPHGSFFTSKLFMVLCLLALGALIYVYLKQRQARAQMEEAAQELRNQEREELERQKREGHL